MLRSLTCGLAWGLLCVWTEWTDSINMVKSEALHTASFIYWLYIIRLLDWKNAWVLVDFQKKASVVFDYVLDFKMGPLFIINDNLQKILKLCDRQHFSSYTTHNSTHVTAICEPAIKIWYYTLMSVENVARDRPSDLTTAFTPGLAPVFGFWMASLPSWLHSIWSIVFF